MKYKQRINLADKFYISLQEVNPTMTAIFDWHVHGEVCPETFRAAWMTTLQRVPPLRSVLRGKEGLLGRLWWEEQDIDGEELFEYLDFFQEGKLTPEQTEALYREMREACSRTSWNVRKDPPVRAKLVRKGQDLWGILLVGNHAMLDGQAGMAIFQLLADNYRLIAQGPPPPEEPIPQANRSLLRFLLKTSPWKLLSTLFAYFRYEWMNRPRANTPFVVNWKERLGIVRDVELVLPEAVTEKISARVRDLGVTLNEAMILACVRNVYRWLGKRGHRPEKISIAMPVNLRGFVGLQPIESMANYGFTMNINIPGSIVEKASRLVKAVRFQSHCLKRLRFSHIWILQTALYAWLPLRILKRIMQRSIDSGMAVRSTPTLVLANIGKLFLDEKGKPSRIAIGSNAFVEGLRISSPVAYPMPASMVTMAHAGKIQISLSYLDPALEKAEMEEFLQGFRRELFCVMDEEVLMKESLAPFSEILRQTEGT